MSLTAVASGGETQFTAEHGELGIAAADLVRQMGGRVTTESPPGAGVRFTIWLAARSARDVEQAVGPVMLWPPIAFEYPQ